jgi:hypothetical protein
VVVAVTGEVDVYTGPALRTELAGLAAVHRHLGRFVWIIVLTR